MLKKMLKKLWNVPVWSKVIAAIIVALLVSVARYLAGSWSSILTVLRNALSTEVPVWVMVVVVLLVFLTRFPVGQERRRLRGSARGSQEEISFAYLPEPPTMHGWTLTDEESPHPKFTALEDGFLGKTLRIEPQGRYGLDYLLPAVSSVPRVTVTGKWTSDSSVYLRIKLVSSSGQNNTTGWIHLGPAITVPTEIGDQSKGWYEWSWPVSLTFENVWQRCTIDVEQAVAKTFGLTGWKYAHLEGYRVRGKFDLARISWECTL